jgi:hypothetical protein
MLRIGGELYLAALVVRDIYLPWYDPVRADGLSDDPVGGVLDEGIDSAAGGGPWSRYDEEADAADDLGGSNGADGSSPAPLSGPGGPPERDPLYS